MTPLVGIPLLLGLGVLFVYALNSWDTGYSVGNGATVAVNGWYNWALCKRITNNCNIGGGIFVPTKSDAEWQGAAWFLNKAPSCVSIAACGCKTNADCTTPWTICAWYVAPIAGWTSYCSLPNTDYVVKNGSNQYATFKDIGCYPTKMTAYWYSFFMNTLWNILPCTSQSTQSACQSTSVLIQSVYDGNGCNSLLGSNVTLSCLWNTAPTATAEVFGSCVVPVWCTTPRWTSLPHWGSITAYAQPSATTCQSETRTCNNGSLWWSYQYPICLGSCSMPWNQSDYAWTMGSWTDTLAKWIWPNNYCSAYNGYYFAYSDFYVSTAGTITIKSNADDDGKVWVWKQQQKSQEVVITPGWCTTNVDACRRNGPKVGTIYLPAWWHTVVMMVNDLQGVKTSGILSITTAGGTVLRRTSNDSTWCGFGNGVSNELIRKLDTNFCAHRFSTDAWYVQPSICGSTFGTCTSWSPSITPGSCWLWETTENWYCNWVTNVSCWSRSASCVACNDGLCSGGEDAYSCASDCGSCGDGICASDEDAVDCGQDCGYCGDGYCSWDEDAYSCSDWAYCGDGYCSWSEDPWSCGNDCSYCGDGICSWSEDYWSCYNDCY